jgi:beta-glucosidase
LTPFTTKQIPLFLFDLSIHVNVALKLFMSQSLHQFMPPKITLYLFSFLCLMAFLFACGNEEVVTPTAVLRPTATPIPTATPYPYQDPGLPTQTRVEDLLARMTLREKIGQMTLVEKDSIEVEDITTEFIGGLLSGGGGSPGRNTPQNWADMVNAFQQKALESRLGIPLIYGVDAVHGHGNLRGAVIFPHNIGLGATRNPELMREIGRITAVETAATSIFWNYAPVVAVPQDIRWGRTYEGFSENTDLVTLLSVAYMQGLQGADLSAPDTVLATVKHFVGDGGTVWGSSTTGNYMSDQGVMEVDEEALRTIHLPPYAAAVEAGAQSIMVSFSSWQDTKMHAQAYLLTDVLKGELGFTGFLVSDWQAIDQIDPTNYYESVVASINAGVDMNMVPYDYGEFIKIMEAAFANGDISIERIDDAVRRILTVKFEMGLFERPYGDETLLELVGSEEHRAVARDAVRQSLVLLKNDNQTLPIAKNTPLIFVAGEGANNIGLQSGGWTIQWQGEVGDITEGSTILEGIRELVSPDTQVNYNNFTGDTVADVGIVVVGERPYAEGFGDSDDLYLSDSDVANIERMHERAERVVVIILSGRPLIITNQLSLADAWVAAWLPGSEGSAVADVLFGDYAFTGKLPFSWPRSMRQLPFNFAILPSEGCDAPLFSFGYGLDTSENVTIPICK